MQSPAAPHQVGCTLLELAASLPLLVRVNLWPPIMFPFALIFFFFFFIPPGSTTLPPRLLVPLDCSRNICVGSFPACGRRLLCPPGERGGRRAGRSTWIGERREGRRNTASVALVLQGPGWTGCLGQSPELSLHVSL